MNKPGSIVPPRKPTNVSLPADLVAEAKRQGINLPQAYEGGVRQALREQWVRDNQEAIESSNTYVEKHGFPLAKYRLF